MIDAPEAVLKYLCLYCNIHRIPIGNQQTHDNIENVMKELPEFNRFYTRTHLYTVTRSRYTNSLSTSSGEVNDANYLDHSVDTAKLAELETREQRLIAELQQIDSVLKSCLEEKKEYEKKIDTVKRAMGKSKRFLIVNITPLSFF